MLIKKLTHILMTLLFIVFGYLISNVDVRAADCQTVTIAPKYRYVDATGTHDVSQGSNDGLTARGGAGTFYDLQVTVTEGASGCTWTLTMANVSWAGFSGAVGSNAHTFSSTDATAIVFVTFAQYSDLDALQQRHTTIAVTSFGSTRPFDLSQMACPNSFVIDTGQTTTFDINGNPSPSATDPHVFMGSAPGCGYTATITDNSSTSNWLTINSSTTDGNFTSISEPNPIVSDITSPGGVRTNLYLFTHSANSEGKTRFATISLFTGDILSKASSTIVITQASCSVSISVKSGGAGTYVGTSGGHAVQAFTEPQAGGEEKIDVTADSGCYWAVVTHSPWFSVTSIRPLIGPGPDDEGDPLGSTTLGHGNARIHILIASACSARLTKFANNASTGHEHDIDNTVTIDTGLDIKDSEYDIRQTGAGDITLDYVTNVSDLLALANILAGNRTTTPLADVQDDCLHSGTVNVQDLLTLAKWLAGNVSCLPLHPTGCP